MRAQPASDVYHMNVAISALINSLFVTCDRLIRVM